MGQISLKTASGGSVILSPANTASDVTITVPALAGSVVTADASGNVGIGTTTPYYRLHAKSTTNPVIAVQATTAGYPTAFMQSGNGAANFGAVESYPICFINNGNEHARLEAAGNFLIGTALGTGYLQVQGPNVIDQEIALFGNQYVSPGNQSRTAIRIGFSNFGYGARIVSIGDPTATNSFQLAFETGIGVSGYSESARFDAAGRLLVGATSGAYKITCNGQPGANGYTAWTNYSDERLKENVVDFSATSALSKVMQMRPVTFNYNKLSGYDEATRSRKISGFIAQELQAVCPEMVGVIPINDVDYLDTNLSDLNLYLVKAIQEQQAIITQLQADVAALKGA